MTCPRNLTFLAFLEGQAQCLINGLKFKPSRWMKHWLQIMHFLVRTPPGLKNPHFLGMEPESFFIWIWGVAKSRGLGGCFGFSIVRLYTYGRVEYQTDLALFVHSGWRCWSLHSSSVRWWFIHELEFSLKKYGLQIKDCNPETQAGVNQGCCDSFEFLGFDIKHGVTVPNLAKLFVQTIWPERLLEGVSPIGQMATRARGISHISKGCHPEISLLCEALSNRCLYNTRISRYNDFGFLVDGGLQFDPLLWTPAHTLRRVSLPSAAPKPLCDFTRLSRSTLAKVASWIEDINSASEWYIVEHWRELRNASWDRPVNGMP